MNPFLYGYVKWYEWRDRKKAYKAAPSFAALDKKLRQTNPYRISKAFPYGETPLLTLKAIADRCEITSHDRGIDLGCGRGRSTHFLAKYSGCQMQGIDWCQELLPASEERVTFSCEDICAADLSKATFIYLYGTCLEDEQIEALVKNLKQHPARVISISYPLEGLRCTDQFVVSFPWGTTEAYVHT
ncbi:MAG: class I SAM-dependent methyltransferase [Verrucomicrobia bacterium]|nr:class I SAM-dependent methyltransferase [Verrucomicrobiota bacterium]